MIDEKLINGPALSNNYILLKSNTNTAIDTVKFEYKYGTLLFSENDFKKLLGKPKYDSVYMTFTYLQFRPKQKTYAYNIQIDPLFLQQTYLIIKIYNYDNAINKGIFPEKEGYGVEISNAAYSLTIPRLRIPRYGR